MIGNSDYWLFVIDTDTYAGNFERELTAWCTGHVGECGVGQECADDFTTSHPEMIDVFDALIMHLPDEHGCHRPTSVYQTPGYWNDGLGTCWPDAALGSREAQDTYTSNLKKFDPTNQQFIRTIGHYPAYQSVAIFCSTMPSAEILHFLKHRALTYTPMGRFAQAFTITGFRVMQHIEADTELAAYPPS